MVKVLDCVKIQNHAFSKPYFLPYNFVMENYVRTGCYPVLFFVSSRFVPLSPSMRGTDELLRDTPPLAEHSIKHDEGDRKSWKGSTTWDE